MTDKNDAIDLLVKSIEIPSVTETSGVTDMAVFIKDYLSDTCCEVNILKYSSTGADVIALLKGKNKGNCLAVNGHIDTVPYGDTSLWKTDPSKAVISNGRLYGRGSCDMKGGLCASLYAFRQLALSGFVPQHDIIFIGTGDEESSGKGAEAILNNDILDNVESMVICEPTGLDLSISSKGALWLKVNVTGLSSHGAYPSQGINAVNICIKLYNTINSYISSYSDNMLGNSTCSMTQISGGTKPNLIPDNCVCTFDIRYVPSLSCKDLLDKLQSIINTVMQEFKGCNISFDILNNRLPVSCDRNDKIVRNISHIKSNLGLTDCYSSTAYFSDASVFMRDKDFPVVLIGPGDPEQCHKTDEYINISEYLQSIEIYKELFRIF